MIRKIPAGTCIYLTKKKPHPLYIQPDKTLQNDTLYVAYDVRIDGIVVIPKWTRVLGDWVTESTPTISAQLQITRIFLQRDGQDISADSDVIEATTAYNEDEVGNVSHLHRIGNYRAVSNIKRRVIDMGYGIKTLFDTKLNSIYLEIFTKEIPVTVTQDFIPFPCFSGRPEELMYQ